MKKAYPEQICNLYEDTGIEMFKRGDYDFAEELLRAAYEWTDRCREAHDRLIITLNNLAVTLFSKGLYDESERAFMRALIVSKEKHGLTHPDLPVILKNYSNMLRMLNREEEAQGFEACYEVLSDNYHKSMHENRLLHISDSIQMAEEPLAAEVA